VRQASNLHDTSAMSTIQSGPTEHDREQWRARILRALQELQADTAHSSATGSACEPREADDRDATERCAAEDGGEASAGAE
jgi:hypothetical protein